MLLEKIDDISVGSYARVISPKYRGLAEYLMFNVLEELKKLGFQFLNTGGSETESLYIFKQKLAPIEHRSMNILVYDE